MIEIRQPLSFSETGKKDNQEDYLYPQHADINTRIFILCDGMGGHDNGEVASKTAATALGDYLSQFKEIDIPTFESGLAKAYDALDTIDTHSARKPGTTMTCLCLNDNNYLVAHIGDSRIYHIRPSLFNPKTGRGGILYQSSDHSLVNYLLKTGEITEREASVFPQKNIITKAMQPHLERRYEADVYMFDDIEDGDYFFLCSDGILEIISNCLLCEVLYDKKLSVAEKLSSIRSLCFTKTRDNYSCWLIPVSSVRTNKRNDKGDVIIAKDESNEIKNSNKIIPIDLTSTKNSINNSLLSIEQKKRGQFKAKNFTSRKFLVILTIILAILVLISAIWIIIE